MFPPKRFDIYLLPDYWVDALSINRRLKVWMHSFFSYDETLNVKINNSNNMVRVLSMPSVFVATCCKRGKPLIKSHAGSKHNRQLCQQRE